jgi:capsular exopolysaccharide synthesis family protein
LFREENAKQIEETRESVRIQIENLKAQREQWHAKALEMSGIAATYEALLAKTERAKATYEHLVSSIREVDVNKSADQDVVSILEYASLPFAQKPGVAKTISTALLGGLMVGLGILFLLDILDDRLISISEFEAQFPERVLGRIPHELIENKAILSADDERHVFSESFSNLRSSVLYLPYESGRPKTILITSAVPNEGKTTLSSNLAATLALGGAKTLLVDCDLRRGAIRELFGIPSGPGFAEVIAGSVPWREVVHPTDVENLSFLRSGKHVAQPGKNLLGSIVEDFLKQSQAEYDFVVFDSCPVLAADDTTSLAPKLDAVILIVRLGFTRRATLRRAMTLLYERQVNVLGVVLNDVNPTVDGYHYYSYSDYYGTPVEDA